MRNIVYHSDDTLIWSVSSGLAWITFEINPMQRKVFIYEGNEPFKGERVHKYELIKIFSNYISHEDISIEIGYNSSDFTLNYRGKHIANMEFDPSRVIVYRTGKDYHPVIEFPFENVRLEFN